MVLPCLWGPGDWVKYPDLFQSTGKYDSSSGMPRVFPLHLISESTAC